MDIDALALEVGETGRQIRYLIAERCVPKPGGSRSRPHYGHEHVEAVRRFQSLRERYKTSEIRAILAAERLARDGGRIEIAPGLELVIDASILARHPPPPKEIGNVVAALLEDIIANISPKDA